MNFWQYAALFWSFFKIGIAGFGGGYAMLSMIFDESGYFGITAAQFADLNALDMIVPGPIAINAATYVGFLSLGYLGALAATLGVMVPSFLVVPLVLLFVTKFKENRFIQGFLSGIKPAAVGLIAAAALTIASGVIVQEGALLADVFRRPPDAILLFPLVVFLVTAAANIRFKINPILLTLLAGVVGAFIGG